MKSRRPSAPMRSRLLPLLASRLGALGADVEAFLRELGLPPTVRAESESEAPIGTVREAFEAAEDYARDPSLGLNLARNIERGRYGVIEFAARSAPTMHDAVSLMLRYQRLINNVATFSFERRGSSVALEHRLPGEHDALGRHANEFTIANVLVRARDLSGVSIVPARAWFAHPEPNDVGELVRFLGTENVTFDAGASGLAFDAAIFDRRLPTADEPLLHLLDQYASTLLPDEGPPEDPLARVRSQVRRSVGRGPLTLAAIASAMHTSPRTLQRVLEASNATFQGVLDEVRRDLAFEALRDPSRAVNEIALSLGYSDGRAFLRAFRRWSNLTPLAYRHRALAGEPPPSGPP
jgi:AraC-like DNA-binding protein